MKRPDILLLTIFVLVVVLPVLLIFDTIRDRTSAWDEFKDAYPYVWWYGRFWAKFGQRSKRNLQITKKLVKL